MTMPSTRPRRTSSAHCASASIGAVRYGIPKNRSSAWHSTTIACVTSSASRLSLRCCVRSALSSRSYASRLSSSVRLFSCPANRACSSASSAICTSSSSSSGSLGSSSSKGAKISSFTSVSGTSDTSGALCTADCFGGSGSATGWNTGFGGDA